MPGTPAGRGAALALSLLLLAGCDSGGPGPTTGPDPLDGPEHMHSYLAGAPVWKLWYRQDVEQYWKFHDSGTFTAWVAAASPQDLSDLFPGQVPVGGRSLSGMWLADDKEVRLSSVRLADGTAVDDFRLPLNWVDGKLRIEIGEHHYMRHTPPEVMPGTPPPAP